MGDMADMTLENAFSIYHCTECGSDVDYCECDISSSGMLFKPHPEDCQGHEVDRRNSKTGVEFIGCSDFPQCKWTRNK